jgi:hypothetical protein
MQQGVSMNKRMIYFIKAQQRYAVQGSDTTMMPKASMPVQKKYLTLSIISMAWFFILTIYKIYNYEIHRS